MKKLLKVCAIVLCSIIGFQDENQAMDILCAVAQRTVDPNRRKINKHLTVHSVIFNLDEGTAMWCFAEQFQDEEGYFVTSL